jgi:hypothetical protein
VAVAETVVEASAQVVAAKVAAAQYLQDPVIKYAIV